MASLQKQPASGDGLLMDVGGDHRGQRPALVVGALGGGIEQDPVAGVAEAQAELDVFDPGLPVGLRIKAAKGQHPITPHGATASPEVAG